MLNKYSLSEDYDGGDCVGAVERTGRLAVSVPPFTIWPVSQFDRSVKFKNLKRPKKSNLS